MVVDRTEAYEVYEGGSGGPVVLLCEHASTSLPEGWQWPDDDRWLVGTHWSWDPGAAEITRELADLLGARAVLSRFSRLVVDPNRSERSHTLFRDTAEGRAIALNTDLADDDRTERICRFHRPYHRAANVAVAESRGALVFSVHTFTPIYEGTARSVEVGVLFDEHYGPAAVLRDGLRAAGIDARLNEPYSGANGMMYSAVRHGRTHRRTALELEVRQDLACDPSFRGRLVALLADALG